MSVREAPGTGECIHGLETAMCDVCSPRQAPEPVRKPAAASTRVRRAAPSTPPTKPAASSAARVEQRIYTVVAIDRLEEALASPADQDWRTELGSATDPFRWPDAADAARPSDVVVLAATAADGVLQLVAAANEPARRIVRERLDAAGHDVRIVLQPGWWA